VTNGLHIAELLAVVLWMGGIVFFSFFTAPVLARELDAAGFARVVRALFPRYYALGAVCGAALCGVAVARGALWVWNGPAVAAAGLFALLTLTQIAARQWLPPAINAARDAGDAGKARFDRLHALSVRLNALVLLLLAGYVFWMGWRGW
jgi:hypothetical protein